MEMTIYHMPKLGSLLDHEPNLFVENRANRSRPFLPGLFDISKNKPLATIIEEMTLKEEPLEEVSILSPKILGNTLNLQQPKQNWTSLLPANNKRMLLTLHMPLALGLSTLR